MVIGGTYQELVGIPTVVNPGLIGIAESVDVGNFDTTETALVMQDVLVGSANAIPLGVPLLVFSTSLKLIASVVAHEAGHFFGGLHQEGSNATFGIMDQFYAPNVFSGAAWTEGLEQRTILA